MLLKMMCWRTLGVCLFSLVLAGGIAPVQAQEVSKQAVERAANAGDFTLAYDTLVKLAESGDAQAQGFLAYVLDVGEWHVPVDKVRAAKWLNSAANKGDGYANLYLYAMNQPGADIEPGDLFVPSDDYKKHLQLAVDGGSALAQVSLAFKLRNEKEYADSYKWFQEAAANGSVLGEAMQVYIEDVEHYSPVKDPFRLKEYASTGYPLINFGIAAFYRSGRGVAIDWELALKYQTVAYLFLANDSDQDISEFENVLSQDTLQRVRNEAKEMMFRWAKGPNTHLALPAKWCEGEGYWNQQCIANALFDHEACMAPFQSYAFLKPHTYPGYSKCRHQNQINPNF